MTKVSFCTCRSDFQDRQYGPEKRLMNQLGVGKQVLFRCTVCGREHKLGEEPNEKPKGR